MIADGGAQKDTSIGINVVCSLNTVDYEKKFVVSFLESDNMLEVVKAYNYFKAGSSCPLEFSMKQQGCLIDLQDTRVSYSSITNTISSLSNNPEGFWATFCLVVSNSYETISIENIEIT